jgi:DNA-binding NarL/FixJ family response regulator
MLTIQEVSTVSVLVVDDHELAREGVKRMLAKEPDITVVGEAEDSQEALALMARLQPDVVLLDLRLRESTGMDVARAAKGVCPKAKILVLTALDDEHYLRPLFRMGVKGYLLKTASAEDLVRAVREVAAGKSVLDQELTDRVMGTFEKSNGTVAYADSSRTLTPRESTVLEHLGKGMANREVAESLGISVKTVEVHVQHILRKLGAKSRLQAALKAQALPSYGPDLMGNGVGG